MGMWMFRGGTLAPLLVLVAGVAAAAGKVPAAAEAPSAAQQLAAIVARSDEDGLRLFPQGALTRGDARYAAQFGDLITDAWIRAVRESTENDLRQLRTVDRDQLSPNDQLVYDTFRYTIELNLEFYHRGLAEMAARMPIDHMSGMHLAFPQFSSGNSIAPYKTVKDYDDGLVRLDGFVVWIDRAIARMRQGVSRGEVQTRAVTQKIITQVDDFLKTSVETNDFYQPIVNLPADFDAEEKKRLTAAYRRALTGKVFPAYQRLRKFLVDEYLPESRTGAPGLATLPGGDRLYQWNLESFTTTRMTADEIHALGLAEVARITGDMETVKTTLGFQGTLAAFFVTRATDARYRFADGGAVLARVEALRAKVEPMLPRWFGRLPKSQIEVKPIPPAQEATGGGAYYIVGTPDGARKGAVHFNTGKDYLDQLPRMTALFLHEGVPGHHLQGSLGQESEDLPAFLRFGYFLGFGEGWGLYSEWLGYEMGLYDDPVQRFGALEMEMIRAQRLVIDTGLHAKGWTRDRAIAYAQTYTGMNRQQAEDAVDRYIVWPGQATAYTIGKLVIMRLRREAEETLGDRFDVRAFHDEVLGSGALPLTVLEAKIQRWIAAQQAPRD